MTQPLHRSNSKMLLALLATGVLVQPLLPATPYAHAAAATLSSAVPLAPVQFTIGSSTVTDYRGNHPLAAAPYVANGTAMVPVRAMAQGLQASLQWDAASKEIHLQRGALSVHLKLNSKEMSSTYTKNIKLPEAVVVQSGTTFIPARAVATLLGANVTWSPAGQVAITARQEQAPITRSYSFKQDAGGWVGGFADLPVDYEPDIYALAFNRTKLPIAGGTGYGLMLSGMNRSDDLFMFTTRKVEGLKPNTTYQAALSFKLYTDATSGSMGIGGSPAESVYIKAGIVPMEPKVIEDHNAAHNYYRMNIDKGNQSVDGKDMQIVGNMAKPNGAGEGFQAVPMTYSKTVKTNDKGELYLIIGSDSGYEGLTTFYLSDIELELQS